MGDITKTAVEYPFVSAVITNEVWNVSQAFYSKWKLLYEAIQDKKVVVVLLLIVAAAVVLDLVFVLAFVLVLVAAAVAVAVVATGRVGGRARPFILSLS